MKDGDKLASGAASAKFKATETQMTDEEYARRVDVPKAAPKVFCECNDPECAGVQFFSAEEFSDHVHLIHV